MAWQCRLRIAVIVTASVALACVIAYTQPAWSDEGWFASPAYNLAKHGFPGTTVIEPTGGSSGNTALLRIDERTYWIFPGQILLQAAWYSIVPPTLFATRLLCICFVPITLYSLYSFLRLLTGNELLAQVAIAVLGTDFVFVSQAGFARPEMMCLGFGLLAYALYTRWRETHLARAVAGAASALALSALFHPNAVLHILGLALVAVWLDRRRLKPWHFVLAGLPFLIVAIPWALYIMQDVEAFRAQMTQNTAGNGRFAQTWNPFALIYKEMTDRYFVVMGFDSRRASARIKAFPWLIYFATIALVVVRKAWRSVPHGMLLVALLALTFAIQCVFNQKLAVYLGHVLPWYSAVFGLWFTNEQLNTRTPKWVPAVVLGVLVAVQLALVAGRASLSVSPSQREMVAFLRTNASQAKLIWGSADLIFALDFDPRLRDDASLGMHSGKKADVIVVDFWDRVVFEGYKTERPAVYAFIQRQLHSYRPVLSNTAYEVYFNPATMK